MIFIAVISLLYGLPVFLGILLIRYILIRNNKRDLSLKFLKVSFSILILGIISLSIYDWSARHHSLQFNIDKEHICHIEIEELASFLDAPTKFNIKIKNSKHETYMEREFTTQEGSCLIFLADSNYPGQILIEGCDRNYGLYALMSKDLKTTKTDTENFKEIVRLTPDYKVKKVPNRVFKK
jgi:hypothetical protein